LQESTIRRVGETKPISVDIRVIAATNRVLEDEIKAGRFREDLFYRLNVVPVRSPSLKERKDDIAILSHHFLKKFARDYQRNTKTIDAQVMEKLLSYDWPGNVRQLQNLIEQMVVMSTDEKISLALLPPPFQNLDASIPPTIEANEWDLKKATERVQSYTEECLIRKALAHTKNNKTKAAELLGISRRALIYKAQEYKISEASSDPRDSAENSEETE
jgi:two-component system response regulator AtoC